MIKKVNAIEVRKRIKNFYEKFNTQLSVNQITEMLIDVFIDSGIDLYNTQYIKGSYLYRARKLSSSNANEIKKWNSNDYGAPPDKVITNYGRLNEIEESILYLCTNSLHTLKEIKYTSDTSEPVVISAFKIKEDFKSVRIDNDSGTNLEHSNEEKEIQKLYLDFILELFYD